MALNKGKIAIPLSKGINQKIDPKQEPPGSLRELENIQIDKYGEIEKQDGYEKAREDYGYVNSSDKIPFSNINAITSYKDNLFILDKDKALTDSPALGKALFTGKYLSAKVKTDLIAQNDQYTYNNVNHTIKDGFIYSIYTLIVGSSTVGCYISVKNLETGVALVDNVNIAASVSRPKIVKLGDKIVRWGISGGSIYYKIMNHLDYSDITSASWVAAYTAHADKIYDVIVNEAGTTGLLVYKESTAGYNSIVPFFINPIGTASSTLGFGYTLTGTTAITATSVNKIPSELYNKTTLISNDTMGGFLVSYTTSTGVGIATLDPEGSNITLDSVYATTFPVSPNAVTAVARSNPTGDGTEGYTINAYYNMEVTGTATGTSTNKLYMIDNTAGALTETDILATDFGSTGYIKSEGTSTGFVDVDWADFPDWNKNRIGRLRVTTNSDGSNSSSNTYTFALQAHKITSNPFIAGNATPVLMVGRASPTQDSYFLWNGIDSDATTSNPVGLLGYSTASSGYVYSNDYTTGYPSPPTVAFNEGNVVLPGLRKSKVESNDTSFFSLSTGVYTQLDYSAEVANQNEEMGRNLLVAGPQVFNSDNSRLTEHGFLQSPDTLYIHTEGMVSTGTGHPFNNGDNYLYRACYRFEDSEGNIHRSGLSPQLTVSLNANYQNIDIIIPMLNLTYKYEFSTFIELYRTIDDGTLFYKVSDLAVNSSTVFASRNFLLYNYIKLKDTTPDSSLQDNELLYTTGGVLENTPIGAASIMESYKNRVFLGGLEEQPNRLLFSKISNNFVPVEFNDSLTVEVPEPGGKLVALKRMDDKLIIFKERAIYFITGEGPNNLGEQNDFIEPQLITSDLGCKFTNSVAFMPKGLMFMSQKGIYLLTRALGLEYIGAPAEDYRDLTITKTTVVSKKDEVRFLASDGPTVIYNYFLDMWYTSGVTRGSSSTLIKNDYYLANFKDQVFKQTSTTASFGGSMVPIKLETGWLSFAGVQGFQRVYRMLLLGEYKSPHKLQIKIAYDYDDVWKQEKIVDVAGYTESYSYGAPTTGTEATYGDPSGTSTAIAYGGKDNTQYQIRLNFAKQKCEAIKIQIVEVEGSNSSGDAESAGPGFTLSNLSFIVGTKDGDFRIKQSRTFGSTSIT
jgi:hypothetical protein